MKFEKYASKNDALAEFDDVSPRFDPSENPASFDLRAAQLWRVDGKK